jgi:hypothetical protein
MREYVIVGCVVCLTACGRGGVKADSSHIDTTVVAGPPAVPTPAESIRSRPRTDSSAPTPAPSARTSPGAGTSTPAPPPAPPAIVDSVRGIVSVVGTEHERRVMVAPSGGGRRVEIGGPIASLVGHVAGAEVWVTGSRSGATIEASRFVVRTVDNMPAIDGTLRTEGSTLYIVTTNGTRTRIASPPPALVGHDGARVWITGDPARGVASFGFIDPPR